MATTALYRALVKAGAGEDAASEAAQEIEQELKETVTRSYLDEKLRTLKAEIEASLTWRLGVITGVIIAATGLMIKL